MNFENDEVRHLEFHLKEYESENKKLRKEIAEQQKEIERLNSDIDLYRRKLVSELKRHDNLRKTFFELSAHCVDKNKNIDYLLKENERLRVTEQSYEALLKSV